jgi:hypothetical protein
MVANLGNRVESSWDNNPLGMNLPLKLRCEMAF